MTPQHQVGVNEALGWSRCGCVGVDVRLFVSVCVGVCVCVRSECSEGARARRVHQGRGAAAASDWEAGKAGKQDATLTQETGAIGDCLHCYPINRP